MSVTTLSKIRSTTTTSKKSGLRAHDVVGMIFGLIVLSPVWLALTFPSLVVWARAVCGGSHQATMALVAIEILALLDTAVAVVITMPKEGK